MHARGPDLIGEQARQIGAAAPAAVIAALDTAVSAPAAATAAACDAAWRTLPLPADNESERLTRGEENVAGNLGAKTSRGEPSPFDRCGPAPSARAEDLKQNIRRWTAR